MRFEMLPRQNLANLPTPLEELTRLNEIVKGPKIWIKRDDLTGLAFGGNKLRKLEYLIGQALDEGADTIVTSGSIQTNHGRLTAAACARTGLECILVVTEEDDNIYESNRILQAFLGSKLAFVDDVKPLEGETMAKAQLRVGDQKILEVMKSLQKEGKKPFYIPRGGRSLQGTASYVNAMGEIKKQVETLNIQIDYIIVAAATCSTLTGILLGARVFDFKTNVIGISVSRDIAEGQQLVVEEFNRDAKALGYPYQIHTEEVNILGDYLGEGYGIPSKESYEAMELLGKTEAIMLDPIYTGKAMAGLLDLARKNYFSEQENVLFIHTGGSPLLFLDSVAKRAEELEVKYVT